MLFSVPTRLIQEHSQRDPEWLDAAGFAMHLSWFFLPFAFSLVVAFTDRRKMLEFYCWVLAASYLSTVFYLLFPVRPPWMEEGITRILAERNFIQYTQADDNPFAAFPSLHAAIPFVIALFFLLRSERMRSLAWLAGIHGLLISFAVVYLGEHWVLDVLAGWVLAGFVAWLFVSARVRAAIHCIPGDPASASNSRCPGRGPWGRVREVIGQDAPLAPPTPNPSAAPPKAPAADPPAPAAQSPTVPG